LLVQQVVKTQATTVSGLTACDVNKLTCLHRTIRRIAS